MYGWFYCIVVWLNCLWLLVIVLYIVRLLLMIWLFGVVDCFCLALFSVVCLFAICVVGFGWIDFIVRWCWLFDYFWFDCYFGFGYLCFVCFLVLSGWLAGCLCSLIVLCLFTSLIFWYFGSLTACMFALVLRVLFVCVCFGCAVVLLLV